MNKLLIAIGTSLISLLIVSGCSLEHTKDTDHKFNITTEKEFLTEMIPHHKEAVVVSEQVLIGAEDPILIKFLESVISMQNTEIEMMKMWYEEWYGAKYIDKGTYMPMMSDFTGLTQEQKEIKYIQEMIAHHMGAIEMANQILLYSPRTELFDLAQNIIKLQSDEILQLQSMLKQR